MINLHPCPPTCPISTSPSTTVCVGKKILMNESSFVPDGVLLISDLRYDDATVGDFGYPACSSFGMNPGPTGGDCVETADLHESGVECDTEGMNDGKDWMAIGRQAEEGEPEILAGRETGLRAGEGGVPEEEPERDSER